VPRSPAPPPCHASLRLNELPFRSGQGEVRCIRFARSSWFSIILRAASTLAARGCNSTYFCSSVIPRIAILLHQHNPKVVANYRWRPSRASPCLNADSASCSFFWSLPWDAIEWRVLQVVSGGSQLRFVAGEFNHLSQLSRTFLYASRPDTPAPCHRSIRLTSCRAAHCAFETLQGVLISTTPQKLRPLLDFIVVNGFIALNMDNR